MPRALITSFANDMAVDENQEFDVGGPIIGGAIAAIFGLIAGALLGLWQDHRRNKTTRRGYIRELEEEVESNIERVDSWIGGKVLASPQYGLVAYTNYRPKLSFLSQELKGLLDDMARHCNLANQVTIMKISLRDLDTHQKESEDLRKSLLCCRDELQGWLKKHTPKDRWQQIRGCFW